MAAAPAVVMPSYVPDCYLCPGNSRISGEVNPPYEEVYVFDNDHPAFSLSAPTEIAAAPGIYRNAPARGVCRVLCYSPRHNVTLAEMTTAEVADVLACWARQTRELVDIDTIRRVLIFENKGDIVGVSNPHPHCQIYAAEFDFKALEVEQRAMQAYRDTTGNDLFSAIIDTELRDSRRLVLQNDEAVAFVPYFARFPYEIYVATIKPHDYLYELDDVEMAGLSDVLRATLARLDNLWNTSFPYMLVVHQALSDGTRHEGYHCHIQIHPPLRQPGLQKFLAGVETGAGHFLNDKSPEDAAAQLRQVTCQHYKAT